MKQSVEATDMKIKAVYVQMEGMNNDINRNFEALENKVEYLENQSRQNNIKIFGVPEEENEKTWDDTEVIVKTLIRNKLGIEEHIEIERAHCLARDDRGEDETHPQRNVRHVESASLKRNSQPRPIVAKIKSWKVRDTIMKAARKKKPKDTRFMDDFAKRTLERRASKIPKMLEARKSGKTAFLIMDKLVVYDRPPDPDRIERSKNRPRSSGGSASDQEVVVSEELFGLVKS